MPQRGEPVELLVGDRVERPDVAAVAPRQLVEPDVRALRDEHEARHPRRESCENRSAPSPSVGSRAPRRRRRRPDRAGEPQVAGRAPPRRGRRAPASSRSSESLERAAEQPGPVVADVAQLAGQRVRRGWRAGSRSSSTASAPLGPEPGRSANELGLERSATSPSVRLVADACGRRRARAAVAAGSRSRAGQQEQLGERGRRSGCSGTVRWRRELGRRTTATAVLVGRGAERLAEPAVGRRDRRRVGLGR